MRRDLVEILACPEDKAPLRLATKDKDDDVQSGTLTCSECGFVYPIEQGIPNLLPPAWHKDEVEDTS